jgi:mRNA interferase MazF
VAVVVQRFDIYLVTLNPTVGVEMQKTRLCVVISPDELNRRIGTVIIAPMTSQGRAYPTRVQCTFEGKQGEIVLDQLRAVDKRRLVKHLGTLDAATQRRVFETLAALFAP